MCDVCAAVSVGLHKHAGMQWPEDDVSVLLIILYLISLRH